MAATASFHRLRGVLRANAAFSAVGGLVALVGFAPIDDLLGAGNRAVVAATGAGLVGFALVVLAVAGLEPRRLVGGAAAVSVADLTGVAATAVVVATVDLDASGGALLTAVAVVVAGFAASQLLLRTTARRIGDPDATVPEEVHVQHAIAAPASSVWPLLTITSCTDGWRRTCRRSRSSAGPARGCGAAATTRSGRGWNETCTLWDEGHEYAVDVDTSDYPYPLTSMGGRWAVEPVGDGSVISMHFRFAPRPGVVGGVFAAVMLVAFRPVLRRILRGWERQLASPRAAAL